VSDSDEFTFPLWKLAVIALWAAVLVAILVVNAS
jgi:hypothetical protein